MDKNKELPNCVKTPQTKKDPLELWKVVMRFENHY